MVNSRKGTLCNAPMILLVRVPSLVHLQEYRLTQFRRAGIRFLWRSVVSWSTSLGKPVRSVDWKSEAAHKHDKCTDLLPLQMKRFAWNVPGSWIRCRPNASSAWDILSANRAYGDLVLRISWWYKWKKHNDIGYRLHMPMINVYASIEELYSDFVEVVIYKTARK